MATSPISSYSTSRITGLASGMDTDSLIQKLMKTEQMKLDRVFKQTTTLEWKKSAYTDINAQIKTFRDKFMNTLSADNVLSKSVYKANKVNYTENKYVDIKATSTASISSHKISGISLADYAKLDGVKHRNRYISASGDGGKNLVASTTGAALTGETAASTMEDVFGIASGEQVSFSINGEVFTFDHTDTLQDVMNSVNASSKANVTMEFVGEKITLTSKTAGESSKLVLKNITGPEVFGTNKAFGAVGTVNATNKVDPATTTLAQLETITGNSFGFVGGAVKLKINDVEITLTNTMTVDDMLAEINGSAANVTASYDKNADKFYIRNNNGGSGAALKLENSVGKVFGEKGLLGGIAAGTLSKYEAVDRDKDSIVTAAEKMGIKLQLDESGKFSFTVSDGTKSKDFSFDAKTTTLKSMIDKVNGDADINVTMSYSQITDSFTFTSGETGEASRITVSNKGGTNAFGGADSFFGIAAGTTTGKDAVIVIDGEEVKQASNSFVLDGIQFTLKANMATVDPADDDKMINFSISQDIDSVVDKVKAFVAEYNKLVQSLNDRIHEEKDFDYEPLTQEELSAMSEKEIEKFETEAKKGLLRNDTTINSLLTTMRQSLFEKVGDTGLSPHDIGLTTGEWVNNGQIKFDEDKFRAALKENPDAVATVMAASSSSSDKAVARAESGLLGRYFDQLSDTQNTLTKTNIKNTDQAIYDNEKKMSDMLDRMYQMEERYYLQFAQMETLLTSYQQQSSWLTQQLGSLGTN